MHALRFQTIWPSTRHRGHTEQIVNPKTDGMDSHHPDSSTGLYRYVVAKRTTSITFPNAE